MNKNKHSQAYKDKLLAELESIKQKKRELLSSKSEAYGAGRNYKEPMEVNTEFMQITQQIRAIDYRISAIQKELDSLIIVTEHGEEDAVDFNKVYELKIEDAKGNTKQELYMLTADGYKLDEETPYRLATLASPIGNAIYTHKIGETVSFKLPSGEVRKATILSEVKESTYDETPEM